MTTESSLRAGRALVLLLAMILSAPVRANPLAPGDYRFDLQGDAQSRGYLLHLPPQAASGALPVVISLHGGGGNAQQHRLSAGIDAAADRDAYIAVYPNGSGRLGDRLLTWNAGNCCGYAQRRDVDDVGFISRLIDDLQRRVALDPRRIYVAGHSNGGMMAHRLGEALPDRIAAIASVAGAHVPASDAGPRAVPVLHIHSVDDPRALYHGGLGPPFPLTMSRVLHPSVDATLAAWAKRNGCDPDPREAAFLESAGQTARKLIHGNCRDGANITLWKLTAAGHGWPGGAKARERLLGPSTKVIDANAEIWKFFAQFSLPRRTKE
jgi:polyhydroxybutyrate depolymerase